MEFPFNCDEALEADEEGYSIIEPTFMKKMPGRMEISQIIDIMGERSSKVFNLLL